LIYLRATSVEPALANDADRGLIDALVRPLFLAVFGEAAFDPGRTCQTRGATTVLKRRISPRLRLARSARAHVLVRAGDPKALSPGS
jgi:hypothetical protein